MRSNEWEGQGVGCGGVSNNANMERQSITVITVQQMLLYTH